MAFPQGMAYAMIAGIPLQFGVYGAAIAAILGGFFAGSRFLSLGPTNSTAIVLASSLAIINLVTPGNIAVHLPMLLFMVAVILITCAFLRIASVIQYISRTVIIGYITAAALLIISGQVENILGITVSNAYPSPTFFGKLYESIINIQFFQFESLVISLMTLLVYLILKRRCPKLPTVGITLIIVSLIANLICWASSELSWLPYIKYYWAHSDISWLEPLNKSDWKFSLPNFSLLEFSRLSNAALAVALICIIESSSIGKSLAARAGERLDTNQEILSVGMANLGCAFLSGMPASGSLTRSQLNSDSGAATPLSNIFNGIICAIGALAIGPYIQYIPQPVLAVLVMITGVSLINKRAIRIVVRSTRSDAITFTLTFISGLLLPLDTAIYFGISISIILFLRKAASPALVEYEITDKGNVEERSPKESKKQSPSEISIVHVEGDLIFGAAEIFRDQLRRVCEDPKLRMVIVKMRNARLVDATCIMAIEELVKYMKEKNRVLLLSECRTDIYRVFQNARLIDIVGRKNIFRDDPKNPTLSTAKALRRAQHILGGEEANIRIYTKPKDPTL